MAGMEGLGRLFNGFFIAAAGTQAFKMRGASAATVFVNGGTNAGITVNSGSSYGGSFAAAAVIKNVYTSTAANGTAGWTKQTYTSGTAPWTNGPASTYTQGAGGTFATAVLSAFAIFTSELSDPNDYVQLVCGTGVSAFVVLHDLLTQRGPANLEILGA